MTIWMDLEIAKTEIAELAGDWASAELRGDAVRLDALLADDFTCVDAHGRVLGREAWIGRCARDRAGYAAPSWTEEAVRVYGESAVVVGVRQAEGMDGGRRGDERVRGTQVWVDGEGGWRLAALHLTAISTAE